MFTNRNFASKIALSLATGPLRHDFGPHAALAKSGEDLGELFTLDFEKKNIARTTGDY